MLVFIVNFFQFGLFLLLICRCRKTYAQRIVACVFLPICFVLFLVRGRGRRHCCGCEYFVYRKQCTSISHENKTMWSHWTPSIGCRGRFKFQHFGRIDKQTHWRWPNVEHNDAKCRTIWMYAKARAHEMFCLRIGRTVELFVFLRLHVAVAIAVCVSTSSIYTRQNSSFSLFRYLVHCYVLVCALRFPKKVRAANVRPHSHKHTRWSIATPFECLNRHSAFVRRFRQTKLFAFVFDPLFRWFVGAPSSMRRARRNTPKNVWRNLLFLRLFVHLFAVRIDFDFDAVCRCRCSCAHLWCARWIIAK